MQVRYQAALRPDDQSRQSYTIPQGSIKLLRIERSSARNSLMC
ncbi:hypothetical protein THICB2_690016 [Thiomonas sp. CB2]|nr:hypothetical protein THICB2_690016 [Thiomonas sp. CB2]